jgi:hypothetical protein
MLLLLRNVLVSATVLIWIIYAFCCLLFLSFATIIILKRLVPALKGKIALQLDDEGISDCINDVSIDWNDIDSIKLIQGRSASLMQINLKFESDRGSRLILPLRWVKGKDSAIYEKTLEYFERNAIS